MQTYGIYLKKKHLANGKGLGGFRRERKGSKQHWKGVLGNSGIFIFGRGGRMGFGCLYFFIQRTGDNWFILGLA